MEGFSPYFEPKSFISHMGPHFGPREIQSSLSPLRPATALSSPSPTKETRESYPLDLVHSDVCGPITHQSLAAHPILSHSSTMRLGGVDVSSKNKRLRIHDLFRMARDG